MERLLCIVPSMNKGGAETFIMKLYRKLDKNIFQLDFISNASGLYDEEIKSMGGKIFYIPLRTKHIIKSYCSIKNIVKKNNYKKVLKFGSNPISVIDLLAAKSGGASLLAIRTCNANSNDTIILKILNNIMRPLLNKIANLKIAPSDFAANYTFGKKYCSKNNIVYLNNGLDLSLYEFDESKANYYRNQLGLEGKTIYGHIGRFVSQKNHEFLIDVFNEILKKDRNSILLLIGDGPLMENIKFKVEQMKIDENVKFLGIRDDISDILSVIDLMLLPSLYEGMPNVIIEAQANGLHCIVSDKITKQCNLTDLVSFLPLDNPCDWAEKSINIEKKHLNKNKILKEKGYDINDVSNRFYKLFLKED